MFPESSLLPISALQHLLFCERQCALIHVERLWAENRLTTEGKVLHERVDTPTSETRHDVHLARHLSIRSLEFGISGIADMVEYHRASDGVALAGQSGLWLPYPIEYKRGKPKENHIDEVQLCAQVLCLEEMHSVSIGEGAFYYGTTHRRVVVAIDEALRSLTASAIERLREIVSATKLPSAEFTPKCRNCSLIDLCMPQISGEAALGGRYWKKFFGEEDSPCANC